MSSPFRPLLSVDSRSSPTLMTGPQLSSSLSPTTLILLVSKMTWARVSASVNLDLAEIAGSVKAKSAPKCWWLRGAVKVTCKLHLQVRKNRHAITSCQQCFPMFCSWSLVLRWWCGFSWTEIFIQPLTGQTILIACAGHWIWHFRCGTHQVLLFQIPTTMPCKTSTLLLQDQRVSLGPCADLCKSYKLVRIS